MNEVEDATQAPDKLDSHVTPGGFLLCVALAVPALLAAKVVSVVVYDPIVIGFFRASKLSPDPTYTSLTHFVSTALAGFVFVWVGALFTRQMRSFRVWMFATVASLIGIILDSGTSAVAGQAIGSFVAASLFWKQRWSGVRMAIAGCFIASLFATTLAAFGYVRHQAGEAAQAGQISYDALRVANRIEALVGFAPTVNPEELPTSFEVLSILEEAAKERAEAAIAHGINNRATLQALVRWKVKESQTKLSQSPVGVRVLNGCNDRSVEDEQIIREIARMVGRR